MSELQTPDAAEQQRKRKAICTPTPVQQLSLLNKKPKTQIIGLRQMSWQICQYLSREKTASFSKITESLQATDAKGRRRAYDALNVLLGLDTIISKDALSKQLHWNDTTTTTTTPDDLDTIHQRIQEKQEQLKELLVSIVCYRNLVLRNARSEFPASRIPLPCLLVRTAGTVSCQMSPARDVVWFDFSGPFEITDDTSILQQSLNMHTTSFAELQSMLSPELLAYCLEHSLLDGLIVE